MRSLTTTLLLTALTTLLYAQTPTFSEDVAPIIYNNCTQCHRQGDIAPFVLETYEQVSSWAPSIRTAVLSGVMPPWLPDVNYSKFSHERTLTVDEINTIVAWVDGGTPEGNPIMKPDVPKFAEGRRLPDKPDLTLRMPLYESQASTADEYACFPIALDLTEDKFIKAIEVVPGNLSIVHHVIVFSADANETDCGFTAITGRTLTGYAPGAPPTIFPNGDGLKMGMKLAAGSSILLQLHYPKGTFGELDSTKVNFYFYPKNTQGIREVEPGPYVTHWGLEIPANTIKTYDAFFPYLANAGVTTTEDMSIFGVFPHMHLIGTKMISFAVTSTNDTIPLVNIEHWDFEWQGFYTYKNMIKVPKGSVIYGRAVYDNTVNNHHNPYSPPQTIYAGEATTDEMLLISYQSLTYEPGDEDIILEDLLVLSVNDRFNRSVNRIPIKTYPNPTTGQFEINGWKSSYPNERLSLTVTDVFGKTVLADDVAVTNGVVIINLDKQPDGVYMISLESEDQIASEKVVLMR